MLLVFGTVPTNLSTRGAGKLSLPRYPSAARPGSRRTTQQSIPQSTDPQLSGPSVPRPSQRGDAFDTRCGKTVCAKTLGTPRSPVTRNVSWDAAGWLGRAGGASGGGAAVPKPGSVRVEGSRLGEMIAGMRSVRRKMKDENTG